jgi:hypothetical protein
MMKQAKAWAYDANGREMMSQIYQTNQNSKNNTYIIINGEYMKPTFCLLQEHPVCETFAP